MGFESGALLGIIGAITTAGSAAYSAYVQQDNASDATALAAKQAEKELQVSEQDAANIREKAARLKSIQRSSLAASGVKVDAGIGGTADVILGETDRLAEQDALAAINEGKYRAGIIKDQGNLAAGNMRAGAVSSALGGVSALVNGVTSYNAATKGTRAADETNKSTNAALAKNYSLDGDTASIVTKKKTYSLLGG